VLTRAELAEGGNIVAAEDWAEQAGAAAAAFGLSGRTGLALLAQAQVYVARRSAAALECAITAREALTGAGLALDAARARLVVGQALAEVTAAAETFAACGAVSLVRQVATERRRLASRGPRTGLNALTRREREVASLVSEGLTNGGIARRLYITEKTVEMHLSHIFAKLDASSRAGVAAAVASASRPSPGAMATS
jgi:DNA-binding NarL/FixJ family response regulator